MYRVILVTLLCVLFSVNSVVAQTMDDSLIEFENRLDVLNQTPITQSLRYKTDQNMFAMRVIDSNRQVVGSVEDVKFDEGGVLVSLVSEINNVGRRTKVVEHETYQMTFHDQMNAFEIPLSLKNTPEVSAQALAEISPSAGGGKIIGLKGMLGAEVRSRDGRWLGEVANVVFDEKAEKVIALVLQDVPGASRYKKIAMPFVARQIEVIDRFGRAEFRVERAAAIKLTEFAEQTR